MPQNRPKNHLDPDHFTDDLPQPYRMIVKILEFDILDSAWLEITRRHSGLNRNPDGTQLHVPKNDALRNMYFPSSSSILGIQMKNISSFESVFEQSNLYFFTSFPTTFGIFSSTMLSSDKNGKKEDKSTNDKNIKIEKSVELLPIQNKNLDGTSISYVPLPVWTFKNSSTPGDTTVDMRGERRKSTDLGPGSGTGNNIDREDGGSRAGNIWIVGSKIMKNSTNNNDNNNNNNSNNNNNNNDDNNDLELINVRVCICLRVKEVEKEVINVEKVKRKSLNLLSTLPKGEDLIIETKKKSKFSCHFFLVDSVFQEKYRSGCNYDILSFSMIGTAVVTIDQPDSRIFTDISQCGRFLTITTDKQINVFPLPIFLSNFVPQGGKKSLQTLKEFEEEIENNNIESVDLVPKTEFVILQQMKIVLKEKEKEKEKDKEKENSSNNLFSDFKAAVVVSTKITKIIMTPENPQIVPKVPAIITTKKSSILTTNSKSKNSVTKIPNNVLNDNGGEGDNENDEELLLINLKIAIFNLKSSFWFVVEGSFTGKKIKNKNDDIKNSNSNKNNSNKDNINHQINTKNYINAENSYLDFVLLDFIEMKKELEISITQCWKLPSNVSVFSFLEDRSMVALGLNNGVIATWDLKVPGRSLSAVLGQHKNSVSALKFWRQPYGSNLSAMTSGPSHPISGNVQKSYIGNNLLHLISSGSDGTICFFDLFSSNDSNDNNHNDYNNNNKSNNNNLNMKSRSRLIEFRNDFNNDDIMRNDYNNNNNNNNNNNKNTLSNKKIKNNDIVNIHLLNSKEGCLGIAIISTSDGQNAVYDALNGILLGNISLEKRGISTQEPQNIIASNYVSKKIYSNSLLLEQIENLKEKDKDKDKSELHCKSKDEEIVVLSSRNVNKIQSINSDKMILDDKFDFENSKECSSSSSSSINSIPNNVKFKPFISSNNKSFDTIFYLKNKDSFDLIFTNFDLDNFLSKIYPDLSLHSSYRFSNYHKTHNIISNYLNISSYERKNLSIYKSIININSGFNNLNSHSSSLLLIPNTDNRTNTIKKNKKNQNHPLSNGNKLDVMNIGKLNLLPGLCGVNNLGTNPGVPELSKDPFSIARQFAIDSQLERIGRKTRILRKLENLSNNL